MRLSARPLAIVFHPAVPVAAIVLTLPAIALAQTPPPPPPPAAGPAAAQAPFETGGSLPASQFLEGPFLQADYHRVNPEVACDGLHLTYSIESPFGFYRVQGTELARERIREIGAIARLKEIEKSEVFVDALKKAGASKLKTVGAAFEDPVGTLQKIPKGAGRFFTKLGESVSGEKSQSEDAAYKSVLGASRAKRELAAGYGVDPYSSNEALQSSLEDVAWAKAAGGLTLNVGTMAVGGWAGTALSGVNVTENLINALVVKNPADLRIDNRQRLANVAVSSQLIETFLDHPHISPTHETFIANAIASLGSVKGNDLFFQQANASWNEDDARYFHFLALILQGYHQQVAEIVEIRDFDGTITALDANGVVLVPVALDYGMWTERAAGRVAAFLDTMPHDERVKGAALWVTGDLSPRFLEEMKKTPIAVQTHAIEHLRQLAEK